MGKYNDMTAKSASGQTSSLVGNCCIPVLRRADGTTQCTLPATLRNDGRLYCDAHWLLEQERKRGELETQQRAAEWTRTHGSAPAGKLRAPRLPNPSRAWAYRLKAREERGEDLLPIQREFWRAALAAPEYSETESDRPIHDAPDPDGSIYGHGAES